MLHCEEYEHLSRRGFFGGGLSQIAHLMRLPHADLADRSLHLTFADPHVGPQGDTLVCIFLRGGADGLNIIVPHGDEAYYEARPTLAIAPPDSRGAAALDLDGFFGLHPALEALHPIYEARALAAIHAVGSPDRSRSHFQAMAEVERASFGAGEYSGWLARHLATLDTGNESSLRALAVGEMVPASLAGSGAAALRSIEAYRLEAPSEHPQALGELMDMLYAADQTALGRAGQRTLETLSALRGLEPAAARGRAYPESAFGAALQTVSRLVQADLGVEVACVDLDGWDTHAAQGAGEGVMAGRLTDLGEGLAAFYEDLGPLTDRVTVIVMTEFGRRVAENAALGTDHGTGSVMLLMGDGIQGGQVIADWPGLGETNLLGPGDLQITMDYRSVLAEVITNRLNNPRIADIFPDHTPAFAGIALKHD